MSSPGFEAGVLAPTQTAPDESASPTWNDYLQSLRGGVDAVGGDVAAGVRYIQDKSSSGGPDSLANVFQDYFRGDQAAATNDMSDAGRNQLQEAVTDPDFWKHPFNAGFLKTINMGPMVAASIAPALISGGASIPAEVAGLGGSALVGGAINAGASSEDVYKMTDALSDKDFAKQYPFYANLRKMGVPEADARAQANDRIQALSPLINALVGAGATLLGPAGKLAGLPIGTAGAGLLKRVGIGAGEAGLGMGLQSGVSEATNEAAQQAIDPTKTFDPAAIAAATIEGGITGAFMGAAGGLLPNGPRAPGDTHVDAPIIEREVDQGYDEDDENKPATHITAPTLGPDAAQAAALKPDAEILTPRNIGEKNVPAAVPESTSVPDTTVQPEPTGQRPPDAPTSDVVPPAPPGAATGPVAAAANDAGRTVPEPSETFAAQRQQLVDGNRQAMLYPKGSGKVPKAPDGFKMVATTDGTFHYNPKLLTPKDIYAAVREGRINELLGIGPYSKADVAARIANGEKPVGVVGRDANGTEVQSAIGTPSTAPEQAAAIARDPKLTVGLEHPDETMARRQGTTTDKLGDGQGKLTREGKRVLKGQISDHAQKLIDEGNARAQAHRDALKAKEDAATAAQTHADAEQEFVDNARKQGFSDDDIQKAITNGKGKHVPAELRAVRENNNANAQSAIDIAKPGEGEDTYRRPGIGGADARAAIITRAHKMLVEAHRLGVELPQRIKPSADKTYEHNNAVVLLKEAMALTGKDPKAADFDRFLSREAQLRSGKLADKQAVMSDRVQEGNARFGKDRGNEVTEKAADVANEETPVEEAEPEARERTPVTLKGDEVTAGKDKTGTFTTEKKRRITYEGKKPVLSAKGDAGIPAWGARTQALIQSMHKLETTTVSAAMHSALDVREGVGANLNPYIQQRINRVAGKVPVHWVDGDALHRLVGNDRVDGFYTPALDEIYLSSNLMEDPARIAHVIQHEALHAALHHVIEGNADARQTIERMMGDTMKGLIENPFMDFEDTGAGYENLGRGVYGFHNAHEFISEAMSNPHFQKLLASTEASPELTTHINTLSKLGSVARALIDHIRDWLGLPRTSSVATQLENAFKLTNNLFDQAETSTRGFGQGDLSKQMHFSMAEGDDPTSELFRMKIDEAFRAGVNSAKASTRDLIDTATSPAQVMSKLATSAKTAGGVGRWVATHIVTNDQLGSWIEKSLPQAKRIFQTVEKIGVTANKLKEQGLDLNGALIRAGKKYPGLYAEFTSLVNDQTMHGVDASEPLGSGNNAHLSLAADIQKKIDKGVPLSDIEHDTALNSWEARRNHPDLQRRYQELVAKAPEFKPLMKSLFNYYANSQRAMMRDQINHIIDSYDFKGTDAERNDITSRIYAGKWDDDFRNVVTEKLGAGAAKQLEATKALQAKNGVYAPLMRHGEHAIIGKYSVKEPTNAINKIGDNAWEFKTRKEAFDFQKKLDLNANQRTVYYDPTTGERTTKDDESQAGSPEQRFRVTVDRDHLEFHDTVAERDARLKELKASGLFDKLGAEERRRVLSQSDQFSDRGTQALLKSLEQSARYRDMDEGQRDLLRKTITETGLRNASDNRVQSRRLPRRGVKGASDDAARNLYIYNNSQANYRARMRFRNDLDGQLKDMWAHVEGNRYDPSNEERSANANEVERRVRAQDPNEYTGAYTDWTRRMSTWSYVDRMARPSHLILHQTHLPMITAPYMAGRHGVMRTYGTIAKVWKQMTGAYRVGGKDFTSSIADALHKGADYGDVFKNAFRGAPDGERIGRMYDTLAETGLIHPQAGLEVQKYAPHRQVGGPVGVLDRSIARVDTVFRHLTNATEAINRFGGATAAYRLEYQRLTRAGKSDATAHDMAVEYARKVISDTQGLYSATNAAPIFKNKLLRPFLQFKQFPQMMYHLLGKLAVDAIKGESKEVRVQSLKSLGLILGSHAAMAGVLQGLPLEAFKVLGFISKQTGLTDGDWSDVEQSVRRHLVDTFGKDAANVMLNGLGTTLLGVDVHHRLGLNSFITYGLPDRVDDASTAEFLLGAVAGAPGGLAYDAFKGTQKMMSGDVTGGALEATPFQGLRDIHQAIWGEGKKSGFEPTLGDRIKRGLGFTPAADAQARDRQSAVYNATHDFTTQRKGLIKAWASASPTERNEAWQEIERWNAKQKPAGRIHKGDLIKAVYAAKKSSRMGTVAGVTVNKQDKGLANDIAGLY